MDATTAERWKMFQLNLTGPPESASFNPFVEVDVGATFELVNDVISGAESRSQPLPQPLVALDLNNIHWSASGNGTIPNQGKSSAISPSAQVISVMPSSSVPAGSTGVALNFGVDVTDRHVVELPGDKHPFTGGLAGLESFSITGWLNPRGTAMGAGGNRIVNYCNGGGGIDLVWDSGGGGRLKLSVNEWPDGDHPTSSDGSVPTGSQDWPRWVFFAVTYSTKPSSDGKNVHFYFGNSQDAAVLDINASYTNYSMGKVEDPNLPLAFGNFGSGFHANDRLFEGLIYHPQVWDVELLADQIVQVQNRSGCAPSCSGKYCGSDGCGGTCGSCTGKAVCKTNGSTASCQAASVIKTAGFFDGGNSYKIRFAPPYEGTWKYTTVSNVPSLNGQSGQINVVPASSDNHGPVESRGYQLLHADGTPHFSVGSTAYQWTSKDFKMQQDTLDTLRNGQGKGQVFNKLRMTVFPKWYEYNNANPVEVGTAYAIIPGSIASNSTAWDCVGPDCPSLAGSFDLRRFNVSYWQNYEYLVSTMQDMGVIADIIVFHPYDQGHWGFDCMGGRDGKTYNTSNDNFYLRYLGARLSSFSNVWWAMANEWSFCACKSYGSVIDNGPTPVWDELFKTLGDSDPYGRQTSIHNGNLLYNHSQPWITHVSLQGHESDTPQLRPFYKKPVVWDEVKYEGNISSQWGALSGAEETDRFWWGASLGVYVGHSETVLHGNMAPDDVNQPLWWAKGGTLVGTSPSRIQWFRSTMGDVLTDFNSLIPTTEMFGDSGGLSPVAQMLSTAGSYYFIHFLREGIWTIPLPKSSNGLSYCMSVLDYWDSKVLSKSNVGTGPINYTMTVPAIPYNVEISQQCS